MKIKDFYTNNTSLFGADFTRDYLDKEIIDKYIKINFGGFTLIDETAAEVKARAENLLQMNDGRYARIFNALTLEYDPLVNRAYGKTNTGTQRNAGTSNNTGTQRNAGTSANTGTQRNEGTNTSTPEGDITTTDQFEAYNSSTFQDKTKSTMDDNRVITVADDHTRTDNLTRSDDFTRTDNLSRADDFTRTDDLSEDYTGLEGDVADIIKKEVEVAKIDMSDILAKDLVLALTVSIW